MKNLYILLVFLFSFGITFAQQELSKEEQERREKNIQAGNPFAKFGYKAKVATLSKGKYLEVHDLDSIVTIGSVRYHVDNKKIVGFVPKDTTGNMYARPTMDTPSRWLSPDPLMEEFPDWSPYNFVMNNPIRYVDPDGRAPLDHIFFFKNGKFEKMVDTGVGNKLYFNIDGKNMSLNPFANGNQNYYQKVSEYYAREIGFSGTVNHVLSYDGNSHAGGYYDPSNKSINTVPATYSQENLYDTKSIIAHEYHHSTQVGDMTFIKHAETYMFEAQQPNFGKTSNDYKANNARQFANRLLNALDIGEFNSSKKSIDEYINNYNKQPNTLKISINNLSRWGSGKMEADINIRGYKTQSYEKLKEPEH